MYKIVPNLCRYTEGERSGKIRAIAGRTWAETGNQGKNIFPPKNFFRLTFPAGSGITSS